MPTYSVTPNAQKYDHEIIEYIQIYSVIYYIFYMDYENFLEKSLEFIQLFCFRQSINVKSTNASVWKKTEIENDHSRDLILLQIFSRRTLIKNKVCNS